MVFDVRRPIGLLFLALGLLVGGYGLLGDPAVLEAHSPGFNIDLIWGAVMAAFGAIMLTMTVAAARRGPPPADDL